MELRSARTYIRLWRRQDDELADEWPPYDDPLDTLWNLPRQLTSSSTQWYNGFDGGSMRRTWAVEDHRGQLIGRISLREIDERRGVARLGITFGAPYVGRGLGTEALAAFLDYYFTDLGFRAMVLDVAGPNQRAVRCYRRLGFQAIGTDWRDAGYYFDDRILNNPRYADVRQFFRNGQHTLWVQFFEMRLDREDWQALGKAQHHDLRPMDGG
jgi:RimJ/RimL family protein N-acetyltransferase